MKKTISILIILVFIGIIGYSIKPLINQRIEDYKRKEVLNSVQNFVFQIEDMEKISNGTYDVSQLDKTEITTIIPEEGTFTKNSNKVTSFNFIEDNYNIYYDNTNMNEPVAKLNK